MFYYTKSIYYLVTFDFNKQIDNIELCLINLLKKPTSM